MNCHFKTCGHTVVLDALPPGYGDFGGRCPSCRAERQVSGASIACARPPAETRAAREQTIWLAKLERWRRLSADR